MVSISKPLVMVPRMVDADKAQMGYIYKGLDAEKESIRAKFEGRKGKSEYKIKLEI